MQSVIPDPKVTVAFAKGLFLALEDGVPEAQRAPMEHRNSDSREETQENRHPIKSSHGWPQTGHKCPPHGTLDVGERLPISAAMAQTLEQSLDSLLTNEHMGEE